MSLLKLNYILSLDVSPADISKTIRLSEIIVKNRQISQTTSLVREYVYSNWEILSKIKQKLLSYITLTSSYATYPYRVKT